MGKSYIPFTHRRVRYRSPPDDVFEASHPESGRGPLQRGGKTATLLSFSLSLVAGQDTETKDRPLNKRIPSRAVSSDGGSSLPVSLISSGVTRGGSQRSVLTVIIWILERERESKHAVTDRREAPLRVFALGFSRLLRRDARHGASD